MWQQHSKLGVNFRPQD